MSGCINRYRNQVLRTDRTGLNNEEQELINTIFFEILQKGQDGFLVGVGIQNTIVRYYLCREFMDIVALSQNTISGNSLKILGIFFSINPETKLIKINKFSYLTQLKLIRKI